jgi:DNA primase
VSFPPAFLDQLRSRLSIAEVIGRRVRLVKKGREHSGLCPFHNEKSPSFTVSEDKGFFHCFGCGAHGDVVGFVMRTENLSFPETVERLAAEAGLEVPRMAPGDRERSERLTGLASLSDLAAKWFESQLAARPGEAVRDYLKRRGVTAETASRFRLGYAPNSRTALKEAMLARGATEAMLIEAGLLIKPDDGPSYDRFRDRLMFPIADRRGRIVAFGGRTMGDASAKYLNSPETPLFSKGRMLYNHAMAREAAPAAGTVVVAEGYMDVIALSQAGFAHAVAPLGTALTEDQMGELWRLAPEPILCFDGDAAGIRAAQRAADRCLPLLLPGRSFRFALLPAGQDPDDLIRDKGREAMAAVLDGAIPLAELLWRRETEGKAFDTPERRAGLKQDLDRLAAQVGDEAVRGHYLSEFRDRFRRFLNGQQGASGGNQARRAGPMPRGGGRGGANLPPPGSPLPAAAGGRAIRREQLLVAALLHHPGLLEDYAEELAAIELQSTELDRLRRSILHAASRPDGLDAAALRRHLTEAGFADLVARLAGPNVRYEERFIQPGADRDTVETGWSVLLAPYRRLALEHDLKQAEAALQQDQSSANLNRLTAIQRQIQDLKSRERALLLSDDLVAAPPVSTDRI